MDDWLDRDQLLAQGLDPDEADAVLSAEGATGNDGRKVVSAERLGELPQHLRERRQP